MKKQLYLKILLSAMLLIVVISCDKHRAKKLSGTYACSVHYQYWDMTPVTIDSVYNQELQIKQEGKYVLVLGTSIHIDSLWKEKQYTVGDIHNYMTVQFKDRHVSITRSGGGLGGSATWTYKGEKK